MMTRTPLLVELNGRWKGRVAISHDSVILARSFTENGKAFVGGCVSKRGKGWDSRSGLYKEGHRTQLNRVGASSGVLIFSITEMQCASSHRDQSDGEAGSD
jgi:hypothetical protein